MTGGGGGGGGDAAVSVRGGVVGVAGLQYWNGSCSKESTPGTKLNAIPGANEDAAVASDSENATAGTADGSWPEVAPAGSVVLVLPLMGGAPKAYGSMKPPMLRLSDPSLCVGSGYNGV